MVREISFFSNDDFIPLCLISEAVAVLGWQRALRFAMPVAPSQSVWRSHNWHPVS